MTPTRQGSKKAGANGSRKPMHHSLLRVKEEFKRDPDVLALKQEFEETREHLEHLKQNVRQPHDPARVAARSNSISYSKNIMICGLPNIRRFVERLAIRPSGGKESLDSHPRVGAKSRNTEEKEGEVGRALQGDTSRAEGDERRYL